MRYQITCDNCGTQFVIEAKPGQTVECKCPHCHGLMEITLPITSVNVRDGEQGAENIASGSPYKPTLSNEANSGGIDRTVLIGIVAGLLVAGLGLGAYFMFGRSKTAEEPEPATVVDTIPYQTEEETPYVPQIDTTVVPEIPDAAVDVKEEKHKADTVVANQPTEEIAPVDEETPKEKKQDETKQNDIKPQN